MIYEPEDTPNGIKTFTTERILAVVSQKYCRPVPRRSVLACAAEREIVRLLRTRVARRVIAGFRFCECKVSQ